MKQILGTIKPARLEAVEQALHELDHLPGFTLFNGQGHARGTGSNHSYSASEWNPDAHDCIVLMMYCDDAHADEIVNAIKTAAYTGNTGDGIIAVSDVDTIVRIRTGELDDNAV